MLLISNWASAWRPGVAACNEATWSTRAWKTPGTWFNIKMSYRKSHCRDKTVVRSSISTMGFPILVRWHLFIESTPVCLAPGSVIPGCWALWQLMHGWRVWHLYIITYLGFQTLDDNKDYRQVSNIRRNLVGNKIVDHSDVVRASPVGAAPTTSSFST